MFERIREFIAAQPIESNAPGSTPTDMEVLAAEIEREGEFFVPRRGLNFRTYLPEMDYGGIHHLARYEWASRVLTREMPRKLIDVACGAGYGSFMLARTLPETSVTGCDYDPRSKIIAEVRYNSPNLQYLTGNMVTWKHQKSDESLGRFNVIVSFDTIEHLLHREIALLNIVRNLEDDGMLLFSTPCSQDYDLLNPAWDHHKIEYSHRTLLEFLRYFFRSVSAVGDPDFIEARFWADEVNKDQVVYPTIGNPLICRGPIRHS